MLKWQFYRILWRKSLSVLLSHWCFHIDIKNGSSFWFRSPCSVFARLTMLRNPVFWPQRALMRASSQAWNKPSASRSAPTKDWNTRISFLTKADFFYSQDAVHRVEIHHVWLFEVRVAAKFIQRVVTWSVNQLHTFTHPTTDVWVFVLPAGRRPIMQPTDVAHHLYFTTQRSQKCITS